MLATDFRIKVPDSFWAAYADSNLEELVDALLLRTNV